MLLGFRQVSSAQVELIKMSFSSSEIFNSTFLDCSTSVDTKVMGFESLWALGAFLVSFFLVHYLPDVCPNCPLPQEGATQLIFLYNDAYLRSLGWPKTIVSQEMFTPKTFSWELKWKLWQGQQDCFLRAFLLPKFPHLAAVGGCCIFSKTFHDYFSNFFVVI